MVVGKLFVDDMTVTNLKEYSKSNMLQEHCLNGMPHAIYFSVLQSSIALPTNALQALYHRELEFFFIFTLKIMTEFLGLKEDSVGFEPETFGL